MAAVDAGTALIDPMPIRPCAALVNSIGESAVMSFPLPLMAALFNGNEIQNLKLNGGVGTGRAGGGGGGGGGKKMMELLK